MLSFKEIEKIEEELKCLEEEINQKEIYVYLENNKIYKPHPVIYHMADIHITNKKERYEEYEKVFEKIYKLLENDMREKIIVICGDLYDNKIILKTSSLKFVSKFIGKLSKYGDVVLINGNHDLSMVNETLESTIESMLTLSEELNKNMMNNIHYLNDDKIYKIKGINFGLTTMFSKKITKIIDKKSNELYVGLYHGKVYGAKTDLRYSVTEGESNFRTTDFNEYDITLLGDIHKHQFLDENKRIAYPSSLVQKHIGETVKNHGLIIWDLNYLEGKFVPIPNDYCICKCILDKNEKIIPEENINLNDYKYITARIEYEKDNINDIYSLEERLKKQYPNIKSIILYEKININLLVNDEKTVKDVFVKNIKDEVIEYIDKSLNSDENKKEMKEMILKIINDNNYDEEQKMKKIELIEIEFDNVFCYGSENKINFSQLQKINGINGENGYGKTSIIDTLLYCLYQKVGKGPKVKILNKFKKKGQIKLLFRVNDELYLIHREIKADNKEKTEFKDNLNILKIPAENEEELKKIKYDRDVIKELVKNNKVLLLNGSDKKISNQIISKIFGSYEDLIDNNIMQQNSSSFINKGDEDKKTILFTLFGLKPYKELYKMITTKIGTIKSSITLEQENLISTEEKEKYKQSINIIETKINEKQNELTEILKIIEEQNYNEKKISEILGEKIDINELIKKINDLEINEKQNQENIKKLLKKINEIEPELDSIYNKIDEDRIRLKNLYDNITIEKEKIIRFNEIKNIDDKINKKQENEKKIDVIKNELKKINKNKMSLNEIDKKLKELKIKLIKYESSKKILEEYKLENKFLLEHKFGDNCENCIHNKKIHEKINYKSKIDELSEFIMTNDLITYTIKKMEDDKNEIIKFHELNEQMTHMIKENENINELIFINQKNENIKKNNKEIQNNIFVLEKEYNNNESTYNEKISIFNMLKKNVNIDNKIKNELYKLKNIKQKYDDNIEIINILNEKIKDKKINICKKENIDKEIKNYEKNKTLIEAELNHDEKIKKNIYKMEQEKNKYDRLLKLFTVDKLLDNKIINIVSNIESIVNNILKDLTDFTIKLFVDIDKVSIYKNKDDELLDAKNLSGYEIFVTNLALRIAFCKLNKCVRSNFLMIDEGFTVSSQNNLPKMETLFDLVRQYFKWSIIVSHLDQIKSNYDFTHTIKKIKCGKTHDSYINI
jgi:DNA repair exonuclease SbcCD ATPase subunit